MENKGYKLSVGMLIFYYGNRALKNKDVYKEV